MRSCSLVFEGRRDDGRFDFERNYPPRHEDWIAPLKVFPGKETPDGAAGARKIGEALAENGRVIVTGCLGAKGDIVRETLYASSLRRHHALNDARAFCAGWKATRRKRDE